MKRASQLTIATAAVFCTLACGDEEALPQPALRPVRYEEVAVSGIHESRTLAGVVRAGVESRLSFRVPGTLERLAVKVGDGVHRGQELARLDPTDYELRVKEAEAARAAAEATLRKAEADHERVRLLYENNNAAKSELDAARAAAESAEAQVEARIQQLEQGRQQLGYTVLRAPQDGAVAAVEVEVNENVQAGQAIFLLVSGSQPEVEVSVPEVLIAGIREGQSVTATVDALPGRSFRGQVTEVGVAVTGAASTFAVTARLQNPDPAIRSGMAAEVTFLFQAGEKRMFVPSLAVGEDREGRFVYVLQPQGDGTGTVERRGVNLGETSHPRGELEIVAGLEEGELVVTAGVRRLYDGMRVKVLDSVEGDG